MSESPEALKGVLEYISKTLELKNSNIKITPTSSGGANFTSDIYKARIVSDKAEILHLFVKVGFLRGKLRVQLQGERCYSNERFFYTELASAYDGMQNNHNISEEDRYVIPKLYGVDTTYGEETIVLEDLNEADYIMHDRMKPVDWHYARVAVDNMAKLHSLSFAYQAYHHLDYVRNMARLEIILTRSYLELKNNWEKMVEKTFQCVDEDKRTRLTAFLENFLDEENIMKYFGIGKSGQIVHGDYTPNNLMYKVENGVTTKIIPVDYQTIRLGSPATDLLYFIYTGTDKEFRKKHLNDLIDYYYERIHRHLTNFKFKPENTFTRKNLEDDYREMLPFGLYSAIFVLPIAMVDEKDAPNMRAEGANLTHFSVNTSDDFKVRFNDIVDEFIKLGVI